MDRLDARGVSRFHHRYTVIPFIQRFRTVDSSPPLLYESLCIYGVTSVVANIAVASLVFGERGP
jgi:hypothetical protein